MATVDIARVDRPGSSTHAVRAMLASRLGCDPGQLRLVRGAHGKPELAEPVGGHTVEFSVSHCGERSLIAASAGRPIGIDLERVRPIGDVDRITGMYFTPAEAERISGLRGAAKLTAFFDCWTAKEAYTKAIGTGLATAFESFQLPPVTSSPAGVVWATIDLCRWTLCRFQPWPGYTAAVAVAGHIEWSQFRLEGERVVDHR